MINLKVFSVAALVCLCYAEPPVQSGGFSGYSYPSPTYNTPTSSYVTPSNSYGAPSQSYNSPSQQSYSPPSSNYNVPSSTYGSPSQSYNTPSSGYNTPSHSYNAPSSSYNAPSNNYKAPSQGYNTPSAGYPSAGYPSSGGGSYSAPSSGYDSHDSHDYHGEDDHSEPKSYEFGYAVKDPYTGNDYGRKETSDGNTVQGEYRVQLPDGRTQIVTYHADWKTGFHADVRYEGEAKYPETSGYTGPKNQFGSGPSTNYGAPASNQGQYSQPSSNYGAPSGSSNSFQGSDFSGSLTGFGGSSNKYDSYAPSGFGSKTPSAAYGTPAFH